MIGVWNVRGLNDPVYVREVCKFVTQRRLVMVGLLETWVREGNEARIQHALFLSWFFIVARGDRFTGRLWIGWDPAEFTVDVPDRQVQWVHLHVSFIHLSLSCLITFVYGSNEVGQRRSLWNFISRQARQSVLPWKLRFLKAQLCRLNREEFSDLLERVERARRDLLRAQDDLLSGVGDPGHGGLERDAAVRFSTLARMEESMLRQKARIRWLKLGDRNTAFFFSSVRSRQNRGGVRSLISDDGRVIRCQQELLAEARGYFGSLLSAAPRVTGLRDDQVLPLIRRVISRDRASVLALPVSIEEVKAVFFALGRHKASGPDGCCAEFFGSGWSGHISFGDAPFGVSPVPHRCTWIWRKLLSMRHLVRDLTAWRMGDGSRISLWYDSWLPTGPFIETLGSRAMERSGVSPVCSVRDFYSGIAWMDYINGGSLRLSRVRRCIFDFIRNLVPSSHLPTPSTQDRDIWLPSPG
ncbi:hypothetical protein Droror1_Dr00027207, partial [Drosera rotundifolia]